MDAPDVDAVQELQPNDMLASSINDPFASSMFGSSSQQTDLIQLSAAPDHSASIASAPTTTRETGT